MLVSVDGWNRRGIEIESNGSVFPQQLYNGGQGGKKHHIQNLTSERVLDAILIWFCMWFHLSLVVGGGESLSGSGHSQSLASFIFVSFAHITKDTCSCTCSSPCSWFQYGILKRGGFSVSWCWWFLFFSGIR